MDFKKEDFPKKNGALERTRTFTPLGAQPPQGCVSTNSTTSAPDWESVVYATNSTRSADVR